MTNAASARAWLVERLGGEAAVAKHFVALSTNAKEVAAFGIDTANMFGFWDWVGGRYSLVVGDRPADRDRRSAWTASRSCSPARTRWTSISAPRRSSENLPVILGLLGVWYRNFLGAASHAVLPYDQHLHRFAGLPAAGRHGEQRQAGHARRRSAVDYDTGPIVWGEPGTNGQHAFYQLIHQGTRARPGGLPRRRAEPHTSSATTTPSCSPTSSRRPRRWPSARPRTRRARSSRAQGLRGEALEALLPHKVFPGNRPTNSILYRRLDPHTLGRLIALYEHKIFAQGVRLGHQLASTSGASSSASSSPRRSCPSWRAPRRSPATTPRPTG